MWQNYPNLGTKLALKFLYEREEISRFDTQLIFAIDTGYTMV